MSLTIQQHLAVLKALAEGNDDLAEQILYGNGDNEYGDEYGDDPNDSRRIEEEPDDDEFIRLFFE